MKKKSVVLLLLGVIAVLVAAYAIITSAQTEKSRKIKAGERASLVVTDLEPTVKLSYFNPFAELSFEKNEDGEWYCLEHDNWPIKQNLISRITTLAENLSALRVLSEHGELSDYNLDDPTLGIKLTDANGVETELYIGLNAGSYYLSRPGDDNVYVISNDLAGHVAKDIYDLVVIDEMPAISTGDVNSIELRVLDKTYRVERHKELYKSGSLEPGDKEKTVEDGDNAYILRWRRFVDGKAVDDINADYADVAETDLTYVPFDGCVAYEATQADIAEYGLDDPFAVIVFTYAVSGGGEQTCKLEIGTMSEDGAKYHVMINDSGQIVTTDAGNIEEIINMLSQMEVVKGELVPEDQIKSTYVN